MSAIESRPAGGARLHSGDARWRAVIGAVDVRFGVGALADVPSIVAGLRCERPLIVTDPGVRAAGHVERLAADLKTIGAAVEIFDGVTENPTTHHVAAGVAAAEDHAADLLIGFGGGSAMDTAKGVNFLFTNGGRMEDYEGTGRARVPMLPSIGIPTTAGTGSEAQSYALISCPDDQRKMACGDPGARFRAAVLDPKLTSTVPREVRIATAIDALAHAVESHVSKPANPASWSYSREAYSLLAAALPASLADDADVETRGRMLVGAHFSGAAIECSMLGAAHATANPLTARYGITHGIAVGVMLPHVVRFNRCEVADLYDELSPDLNAILERVLELAGVAPRLRAHGAREDDLDELAAMAAQQWTAGFNPRLADEPALRGLYEAAY